MIKGSKARRRAPETAIIKPKRSFGLRVSFRKIKPPRMVKMGLHDSKIEASIEVVSESPANRGNKTSGVPNKARNKRREVFFGAFTFALYRKKMGEKISAAKIYLRKRKTEGVVNSKEYLIMGTPIPQSAVLRNKKEYATKRELIFEDMK